MEPGAGRGADFRGRGGGPGGRAGAWGHRAAAAPGLTRGSRVSPDTPLDSATSCGLPAGRDRRIYESVYVCLCLVCCVIARCLGVFRSPASFGECPCDRVSTCVFVIVVCVTVCAVDLVWAMCLCWCVCTPPPPNPPHPTLRIPGCCLLGRSCTRPLLWGEGGGVPLLGASASSIPTCWVASVWYRSTEYPGDAQGRDQHRETHVVASSRPLASDNRFPRGPVHGLAALLGFSNERSSLASADAPAPGSELGMGPEAPGHRDSFSFDHSMPVRMPRRPPSLSFLNPSLLLQQLCLPPTLRSNP